MSSSRCLNSSTVSNGGRGSTHRYAPYRRFTASPHDGRRRRSYRPPPAFRKVPADPVTPALPQSDLEEAYFDNTDKKARELSKEVVSESSTLIKIFTLERILKESSTFLGRRILSHCPFPALLKLYQHKQLLEAKISSIKWSVYLTSDVINESIERHNLHIRRYFAAQVTTDVISASHSGADCSPEQDFGVQPVFDDRGNVRTQVFHHQTLTAEDRKHRILDDRGLPYLTSETPHIDRAPSRRTLRNGQIPSTVSKMWHFEELFSIFTHDVFVGINMEKCVIAGGAVVACLMPLQSHFRATLAELERRRDAVLGLPLPLELCEIISDMALNQEKKRFRVEIARKFNSPVLGYSDSDIDVFITPSNLEEGEAIIRRLLCSITAKLRDAGQSPLFVRTRNTISILAKEPFRTIQLVMVAGRRMAELMVFADLDSASMMYSPQLRNVFGLHRAVRAFNTRTNLVDPAELYQNGRRRRNLSPRVFKYLRRGFSAMSFELCKHDPRCDLEETVDAKGSTTLTTQSASSNYQPHTILKGFRSSRQGLKDFLDKLKLESRVHTELKWSSNIDTIMHPSLCGLRSDPSTSFHGLRWKADDVMRLRGGRHLLPHCYQCNGLVAFEEYDEQRAASKLAAGQFVLLCSDCLEINKKKRDCLDHPPQGLSGQVAVVTGARIKIGFETALGLAFAGMTVIATTRFPRSAARRFVDALRNTPAVAKRIHLYGLDLRFNSRLQEFIRHTILYYPNVSVLVNNAAQTTRRPPVYYKTLFEQELELEEMARRGELQQKGEWGRVEVVMVKQADGLTDPFNDDDVLTGIERQRDVDLLEFRGSHGESQMMPYGSSTMQLELLASSTTSLACAPTMVPLLKEDCELMDNPDKARVLFPSGYEDAHGEQLDLRQSTSWNRGMAEVDPLEMMEVQMINCMAPFMLTQALLPQLVGTAEKNLHQWERDSTSCTRYGAFVINVSSQEGVFSAPKHNGFHPHSNMAKASLNMMTRTLGNDPTLHKVCFVAVDTGWVTAMKPYLSGVGKAKTAPAQPPLSEKDGAARVCDPVFTLIAVKPWSGEEAMRTDVNDNDEGTLLKSQECSTYQSGSFYRHFKAADW